MISEAAGKYLEAVQSVLQHLEQQQLQNIQKAAELVAGALLNGGTVNCSDIGHGIQGDFINRAGGLVAVQPFTWQVSVQNPLPECRQAKAAEADDRDLEQVQMAMQQSDLCAGDVMLLSSVSGRNRRPVELAIACRKAGVATIGFTSMCYTANIESLHPSGKRLFEAVDVAIDIGAPYGDAAVPISGYEHHLIPVSGLGQLVAGWLLWSMVMEKMADAGQPASVLMSHNRAGGQEYNQKSREKYNTRGF